jgi:hypothetical protein
MSDEKFFSLDEIKQAAQRLVNSGQDVREKLSALTTEALTKRQLAEDEIRQVLAAITEGVSLGASARLEDMRSAMNDALHGVDDALGHAAEAMQLALSEAASHAGEFAEQDIKQAASELKNLEGMFLDTVNTVAQNANALVKNEMTAMVEHARRAGTGTGERVNATAENVSNRLRAAVEGAKSAGEQAARQIGSRVALLASRKLSEVAAKIEAKAEALKKQP